MSYYGQLLTTLTGPQRYPAVRRLVAAGVLNTAGGPDDEFIFGLERVLDGIEALVRARG